MVTSEARGCECGGTNPLASMSIRARVRPMVLSPGKLTVLVTVTLDPAELARVSPGLDRADVAKSEAVARFGSMQGAPLRNRDCGLLLSATQ